MKQEQDAGSVEESKDPPVASPLNAAADSLMSSLDQGFRSNIDDQYDVDIAQDEEEEPETCSDFDSEDTNDEIYSAHEGVDFRPTNNEQFRFEGQQAVAG